jgi:hypothetical protein
MELIDSPTELTTAATNIILALFGFCTIFYLQRIGSSQPQKTTIWLWAFRVQVLVAVPGTVVHGVQMSEVIYDLLWQLIYLLLGVGVGLFVVAVVYDLWGYQKARRILPIMLLLAVVFYGVTVIFEGAFFVFMVYEALALFFALGGYIVLTIRGQLKGAGFMALGILLSIIGAVIQATGALSLKLIWEFDHNGIFHIVQLGGFAMIVAGLRAALLSHGD